MLSIRYLCFDPHVILHRSCAVVVAAKNWIESDHAALKRLFGTRQSFRSSRSAKATLAAIETIRTIKNGHFSKKAPGVRSEIDFV
ncbi:DDE-type integrase/transposase/recombinase [uncultured Jannaschia sp.]|uniref:DDE-type integrase/transposase/recombinase n=1 Tax=uncultured Jannaschia sp. TaxID=293347 RepID=UPI002615F9A0|nr:DDE-type integrase/transposase/recombinase [uncultured Jannaschia sp.]